MDQPLWNLHSNQYTIYYNAFRQFSLDDAGRIWVVLYNEIQLYNNYGWTGYTIDDGLLGDTAGIVFEHDGTPWSWTPDKGIARFDGDSWSRYSTWPYKLSGGIRWTFHDNGGNLCLADRDGILRIVNGEPAPIQSPGELIGSITCDDLGRVWCICDNILYSYENGTFMAIDDALLPTHTPLLSDSQHRIWFSAFLENGVTMYIPDEPSTVSEYSHPVSYYMLENYPNPFNPATTISCFLPEGGYTRLAIYNLSGQKIRTLVSAAVPSGSYKFTWDGCDDTGMTAASGIYIARLECSGYSTSLTMTLVK